jgi:N-carbamoyl-L-amino-acid hydrolase
VLTTPKLRIDEGRLLTRLAELSEIGGIDGTTGSSRLAFGDADKAGRDLVVTWMRDLGLELTVDGIGNVVGLWRPRVGGESDGGWSGPAPVMTGSHIDTVRTGGRYDGNLGVLAGLEVIETLMTNGISPDRPLAVAFFSNEEGARFPPDMMGSLVYVGGLGLEEAHQTSGIDGATVADELDRIGYRGPAPCPGLVPHAFVELHIEQGPVLEEQEIQLGVVEGVQGISWTEITIEGQSNHAGTTPMRLRHDTGFAAASVATFVRTMVTEIGPPQVGTVGMIDLHPNLVNVVAGTATMTVDLRNTDNELLIRAEKRLGAHLDELARSEGVQISTRSLARFDPVRFDPGLVDRVESAARALGLSTLRMPSGAGHDAQMMARVCPTAMIFTPSHKGISHNPAEHTEPEDLANGADTLLHVMLGLATDD